MHSLFFGIWGLTSIIAWKFSFVYTGLNKFLTYFLDLWIRNRIFILLSVAKFRILNEKHSMLLKVVKNVCPTNHFSIFFVISVCFLGTLRSTDSYSKSMCAEKKCIFLMFCSLLLSLHSLYEILRYHSSYLFEMTW